MQGWYKHEDGAHGQVPERPSGRSPTSCQSMLWHFRAMINMAPTISVVIPAYNAEKSICRSIDSALLQTDINVEVIVIDDSSSDSTASLIRRRYSKCKNVRLFETNGNSGPSTARNVGINHATGSWIALLDADDWFARDRLSVLHKHASEYDLDLIADSYHLCSGGNTSPHSVCFSTFSSPNSVKLISASSFVRHGLGSLKPIIKREFLDRTGIRFNPSIWRGEDMMFFVTLLVNRADFGLLNTPLYYKQDTLGSLTKSDRVRLLMEMQEMFLELRKRVLATEKEHSQMMRALQYREKVVRDALAMARWRNWVNNVNGVDIPKVRSLFNAGRHALLRHKRYRIGKARNQPKSVSAGLRTKSARPSDKPGRHRIGQ